MVNGDFKLTLLRFLYAQNLIRGDIFYNLNMPSRPHYFDVRTLTLSESKV